MGKILDCYIHLGHKQAEKYFSPISENIDNVDLYYEADGVEPACREKHWYLAYSRGNNHLAQARPSCSSLHTNPDSYRSYHAIERIKKMIPPWPTPDWAQQKTTQAVYPLTQVWNLSSQLYNTLTKHHHGQIYTHLTIISADLGWGTSLFKRSGFQPRVRRKRYKSERYREYSEEDSFQN